MDILFIQSGYPRVETIVTRQDGVRLSVPVFGPLDPIPHDLAHYVVERELGLQNGFWGSVAFPHHEALPFSGRRPTPSQFRSSSGALCLPCETLRSLRR